MNNVAKLKRLLVHQPQALDRYSYQFILFRGFRQVSITSYTANEKLNEEIKKLFLYVLENEELSLLIRVFHFEKEIFYHPFSKSELYQVYNYLIKKHQKSVKPF